MLLSASLPTLESWEVFLRLGVAGALGAAVGFERELRDREAGMRTHLLVALGSALFTIVSAYGFEGFLGSGDPVIRADPTRIAAQIVTGIGFIGAGAIIREGVSIRGLTTAGSLWVVAAVGMAAGAGYYWPAVAGAVLTVVALWPLRIVAHRLMQQVRPDESRVFVELAPAHGLEPLLDALGETRAVEVRDEPDRRIVTIDLPRELHQSEVARLADLDSVIAVRWKR
jgi:putative Mg2+ transporter-C (MgtC) family protein